MKTTLELPDLLFRQAKAAAAHQGVSLKEFFTQAVRDRLRTPLETTREKSWMKAFGGLRDLHSENRRIAKVIAREFEQIEADEWR